MKKLLIIFLLIFLSISSAVAKSDKAEQEVRSFLIEYERGVTSRDVNFLELVIPDDYVYSGPNGKLTNRAQALKYFKEQKDNPDYKLNSLKHENVKVHVVGSMALVTNDWTAQTTPIGSANAEPTTDKGRYTGVFEKRKGRWMVVAEHDSEKIHDDKWMVSGVLTAGREYNELMKRLKNGLPYSEQEKSGDITALSRMLAEEFTSTSSDGDIFNKSQVLASYKTNRIKIESTAFLEQNVRTIDNNAAIETGKIRYVGTDSGKPFDIIERHTTTWAFYDGRWQITADHASVVKK